MDPEPNAAIAGGRADRLSKLNDGTLGHILSFLPAAEAARAAALSRWWRHIFASVHTLSFKEEPKRRDPHDDYQNYYDYDEYYSSDRRHRRGARRPFAEAVSAALLGRHRVPHAGPAPLRAIRVEFADDDGKDDAVPAAAVDGWLHYAALQAAAGDEVHVDLRLSQKFICSRWYGLSGHDDGSASMPPWYRPVPHEACDDDTPNYALPGSLLRCAALRSLRLGSCQLDTPAAAALPSLDTMHLTRVAGGGGAAVQRLVSACPRLVDLTLEACYDLTELSILTPRLRRLALRCCHSLADVAATDASELRSFEYTGPMTVPSFEAAHHPSQMSSCTVNFCGKEATNPEDLAKLGEFLVPFAGAASLQIKSARLGAGIGHGILSSALELPGFHALRKLELTGMLPEDDAASVAGLAKMLELTPILETLSLFFMPDPVVSSDYSCSKDDGLSASHKLRYDPYAKLAVPECAGVACLRERTREINLVYYQGSAAQRMLAKFLLCNARVVGELYCEFAPGPLFIQTKLMEEITGWVLNKSANMIFY